MNLHNFSYFDPTKKSTILFKNNFQRNSLLTALHEKNLRMCNVFFGFRFWVFKNVILKYKEIFIFDYATF